MQCTAPGIYPPDETQLLSSSSSEVIFILVYQMQQHTEHVKKIPPEVCSYMCRIIFEEIAQL